MSIYVDKVSYKGEGYRTVVDYDKWRVAIINYAERFDWDRASQKKLERHNETDEVFVKAIMTHLFFQHKKFKIKVSLLQNVKNKKFN